MLGIAKELQGYAARGLKVRAGLIGAGQMGTDMVAQAALMEGFDIVTVADVVPERAAEAFLIAGQSRERIAVARSLAETNEALLEGKFVAANDYRSVTDATQVDVVIEATGSPEVSARAALRAIHQRKHLVEMSVELDVTAGSLLKWYADRHGVVYTGAAGDEPAAIVELYDFATAMGMKVVCAAKGKNNPLDRSATPDAWAAEAQRRGLTPEMLVEFVDGSKTMIEMCAVANATGLVPDVRGMHGPKANKADFLSVFATKEQGGVLSKPGVVEFVIGDLGPGVFVVVTTDRPRVKQNLVLRDMGKGPNYLLIRPYHLCSMEVPLTASLAVLRRHPTMQPLRNPVAEVIATAKADLAPGTKLERIGGRTHYGLIDTVEAARAERALPLGIAQNCVLKRAKAMGEVITYDDVELPAGSVVIALRALQDRWLAGEIAEADLRARLDAFACGRE